VQPFIEKIRVPVRVHQSGIEKIQGWFALGPQARFHDGPETLLELLNSPARVIPFVRAADEAVLLVQRQAILWVEAAAEVDPGWIRPPSFSVAREERVQVFFDDGRRMEGLLQMDLPEEMNRASDYLNGVDDFFPLITPGATAIIHKSRLSAVRLYEASPHPVGGPHT
jgi:hypothetical protein